MGITFSGQNAFSRLLVVVMLASFMVVPQIARAVEVNELINLIDDLWRGETSRADMTMTIKTQRYERAMSMDAWSLGQDYSLIVIREPKKDKDIATLKVEENIWNYLPKINRVTKVPSSMMSGSWMGSHFTNDDLVKDSSFADDYDSQITFEGERDGVQIYEITSIPLPDAPVVWGKVVTTLQQDPLVPLASEYYDEDGLLVRTMSFDDIRQIGERLVPMRMRLIPQDKPGESTQIVYNDIEFDVPLEESFFSLKNLQRRH